MAKVKLNLDRSFFNEKYIPYLVSDARYNVFLGSAGSGKSHFVAHKLIIDLLKDKKKLLVVRQTFSSIKDSVFTEITEALRGMQILDLIKVSKTTHKMEFPNGSQIVFKGADEETKLLSISGFDLCWIEEASELSKEIFNQLELRLRGKGHKKQFYLTFNPVSNLSWLKAEFFDNPKPDTSVCHSTYKDNRFLDQAYINNILDMKERNPEKYRVFGLGLWGHSGKRVFDNFKIEDFNYKYLLKNNPSLQSAIGMDFGYVADPSTLVASLVDVQNRKIYIFDELYEKGLLNNELAARIHEKGYSKEIIIADSAEQKSIAEIKGYGINRIKPAKKGAGSIMNGIGFIQQFDIVVHPSCIHVIDELENYSFKKDKATGQYLNQPVDNYNHLIDALRYSLERFNSKNKIKFMSKSVFGI
ncbi:PBSX family phage terminase large subunit [Planococcus sp. ANT_H30]|uniref:PBSX family phage terminase large subunit n=1 Tax=Planococcus sp. ANT_H30 TaxID=2597347 RepID=UPI0011EC57B3|nr:PBSX family phage terminase large subunit [Planococcus sp. ANT_H30]KAA0957705.1 PBSX family phage terminase large subunit [Planococcus sp. ANT_H30]